MSSTGATLSGSYSGASSVPTAAGFKWGTTSGNLNQTATATASGTSGNLSATLSGLDPGKTYYYQAFVTVNGTGDYASQSGTFYGSQSSFTTKKVATAVVTTSSVTNVAATTATFNGSFTGASGTVSDHGFYYRKAGDGNWQVVHLNSAGSSGTFTANVSGLAEGTTYEVKAWVEELDESLGANGQAVDRFGDVVNFTTSTSGSLIPTYLDDYGIPDVSGILSGTGTSGTNSDLGDHWFRYNTNSSNRQIAVHTFAHPTTSEETVNYVVMYDGSRYAPLWTAHTMNTTYWPDKNASREDNWVQDPAISLTQISGLDDNSTYSRGHFVASTYRKSTQNQNAQTFYYTNKAPQYQEGFNGGVWSSLETRVKAMAPSGTNTMLYVVTGVLYEGTLTYMSKGGLSVPLPSHFYKCIMRCTLNGSGNVIAAQGIAFVYSNQSHAGCDYYGKHTYAGNNVESFVTSIDAIEQRAGFDFFAKVPDSLENKAESNMDHSWFTGVTDLSTVFDSNWGTL